MNACSSQLRAPSSASILPVLMHALAEVDISAMALHVMVGFSSSIKTFISLARQKSLG